jgi:hypothetical protein
MEWVTADAAIRCGHDGRVLIRPSQWWVTVGGSPVLVDTSVEGQDVAACPNYGPTIKPCMRALRVARGRSVRVYIIPVGVGPCQPLRGECL